MSVGFCAAAAPCDDDDFDEMRKSGGDRGPYQ
jgi:hypothetical protein